MRITAKSDYAIRAAAQLAATGGGGPLKAEQISKAQDIPLKFLLNILSELKRAGLVQTLRGAEGGHRLARPAGEITLADVIRAVEGPLANVHDLAPEDLNYVGPAEALHDVWIAVRAALRSVLEVVTIADLASGDLPKAVRHLARSPGAGATHGHG